jgi:hypothetical protein
MIPLEPKQSAAGSGCQMMGAAIGQLFSIPNTPQILAALLSSVNSLAALGILKGCFRIIQQLFSPPIAFALEQKL